MDDLSYRISLLEEELAKWADILPYVHHEERCPQSEHETWKECTCGLARVFEILNLGGDDD
jgi:hypothetical protein